LDAIHFPTSSSGASAAPPTFTLTPASYSHSSSTSLHSIGFINSFRFFQEDFFEVLRGHIKAPPGHLKGLLATSKGRPPCLFWLPPWENVNRSTTLIHHMWVMSSH